MYVELHARSAFSFLEGAALPEALAERAARLGQPALGLLDRDGLYGAPRLYRAAIRLGITPLVGAEVTLAGGGRLPLLVEDREGYQNLCRLLTRMKMRVPNAGRAEPCLTARRADMEIPRAERGEATLDDLAEHAAGLVCLTGGAEGPVALALAREGDATARAALERLLAIYGRGGVYAELQRHLARGQEARNEWLRAEAAHLQLPLLATNAPRLAERRDRRLLDVLTCIRHHTTLDRAGRLLADNSERHLKDGREMERLFHDCPEAVANTGELALRLGFTLKHLGYRFPDYPLPRGETPLGFLRALCERGARGRYGSGPLRERARRQIQRELDLIGRLDLAGYFLIVWDLVEHCRAQDILVQGRGSAANSAVCYCLGITAVDPVGMDLLFERFLSEERGEWPDIDLDLPSGDRRERVIQYVYQRYGRLGAAMTANVITYRGRSAAREVGKALGFPPELCERLSGLVGDLEYQEPDDALPARLAEAGCDPREPRMERFAELWTAIQDLPRHLGQHSGGMVICQGRLDAVVPLEPATMPGRSVVQWDKDDCKDMGIIKVDLLGLGMMSLLEDALRMIRARGGAVDLAHLPRDDPAVYAMLQKADTIGVFQVESRAQMATLPRLRPERFYDLVVQVAIIRPGPIVGDMVHPYLRRRAGREPATVPHPALEPILARTLGVPLFQEQLLRMAMATAGFTGGEAEELRRAFGFKRSERAMKEVEVKLRAGMARNGIAGEQAEAIVRSITAFALYGFPECVAGDTRVVDADTGRWVRIEDVVKGWARLERTLACDVDMKLRKRRVLGATASGRRLVHRLRTALGREILATTEHPLLTVSGWRALGDLRAGDRIAAASPGVRCLADSEAGWDRVVAIEPVEIRETYDLQIEDDRNFVANDLIVHNSHAASFALLAYASAYLKAHHPAAFYAALLNNQPMGFYHPATIVRDARRHGQVIRPVDVNRSGWLCTIEDERSEPPGTGGRQPGRPCHGEDERSEPPGTGGRQPGRPCHGEDEGSEPPGTGGRQPGRPCHGEDERSEPPGTGGRQPGRPCHGEDEGSEPPGPAVRLGLRYVKGLREEVGRRMEAERARAPFVSVADLVARAGLDREETARLAEIGALRSLGLERRAALWEAARAVRPRGALYAALPDPPSPSPLPAMTPRERLVADYTGTGLTLGPHPVEFHRRRLSALGVARATDLPGLPSARPVRVAGAVVVRQRPGTAKGFVFLNLEDETGLVNVIVRPALFRRHRPTIVGEPFLMVEGALQHEDGVISVRAERLWPLRDRLEVAPASPEEGPPSHDFR